MKNNEAEIVEEDKDAEERKGEGDHAEDAVFATKDHKAIVEGVFHRTVCPAETLTVELVEGSRGRSVDMCGVYITNAHVVGLHAEREFHVFGVVRFFVEPYFFKDLATENGKWPWGDVDGIKWGEYTLQKGTGVVLGLLHLLEDRPWFMDNEHRGCCHHLLVFVERSCDFEECVFFNERIRIEAADELGGRLFYAEVHGGVLAAVLFLMSVICGLFANF